MWELTSFTSSKESSLISASNLLYANGVSKECFMTLLAWVADLQSPAFSLSFPLNDDILRVGAAPSVFLSHRWGPSTWDLTTVHQTCKLMSEQEKVREGVISGGGILSHIAPGHSYYEAAIHYLLHLDPLLLHCSLLERTVLWTIYSTCWSCSKLSSHATNI
jgi:hypothetical protein